MKKQFLSQLSKTKMFFCRASVKIETWLQSSSGRKKGLKLSWLGPTSTTQPPMQAELKHLSTMTAVTALYCWRTSQRMTTGHTNAVFSTHNTRAINWTCQFVVSQSSSYYYSLSRSIRIFDEFNSFLFSPGSKPFQQSFTQPNGAKVFKCDVKNRDNKTGLLWTLDGEPLENLSTYSIQYPTAPLWLMASSMLPALLRWIWQTSVPAQRLNASCLTQVSHCISIYNKLVSW